MFKLLKHLNRLGGVKPEHDIREVFQRRLLGATCFLLTAVIVPYIVFWSINGVVGDRIYPFIGLLTSLFGAVYGLRGLRTTQGVERVGAVLIASIIGSLVLAACFQGGFDGLPTPWFVPVPLLAAYLTRPQVGAFIAAVLVAIQSSFYVLDRVGFSFPNTLSTDLQELDRLIATIVSIVLATVFMTFYRLTLRRSLDSSIQLDELNRHLEQRLRIKSDFLAFLSDDLSFPLHRIQQEVDGLLERTENDEQQSRNLAMLSESASHLSDLMVGLVDVGKLDSNLVSITKAKVSLDDVIAAVVSGQTISAKQKGLVLTTELTPNLTLETDAKRLRQILDNLVTNAIKYSDSGEVKLSSRRTEHHVIVTVSDNGHGISQENLTAIFQPMYQVNQTQTRSGGVGLGLYLVQRLADLLDGEVTVESEVDVGSTFTLRLPNA